MTGILLVNKPMDYTSHDVIAILKGITGVKKIGHTGTLDPNATGVLPVCLGKATKLIEYMEVTPKTYVCRAKLGITSDTDDIWGQLSEQEKFDFPSQEDVEKALKSFLGDIEQIPPMYSAVRVNGRRLYSYARSGETVELKPRAVRIYEIALSGYYPCQGEIVFSVKCSRGTYIRTICKDLGQILGCGAVMSGLVRSTQSGFDISESYDFEELRKMSGDEIKKLLLPIDRAIESLDKLALSQDDALKFKNGMTLINNGQDAANLAVFDGDELIGIANRIKNRLKPVKVFN